MPAIVFAAALLSVIGAIFSKREKWWAELSYITGNILFIVHFFHVGLYGNTLLYLFSIIMCLWTIFQWTRRDKVTKKYLAPSALSAFQRILLILGLVTVMLVALNWGPVRMLDLGMLYVGIAGKLLVARKKIDGWGTWLTGDMIGLALFSTTGAWFLFGRHIICAGINISAIRRWQKDLKVEERRAQSVGKLEINR